MAGAEWTEEAGGVAGGKEVKSLVHSAGEICTGRLDFNLPCNHFFRAAARRGLGMPAPGKVGRKNPEFSDS